MRAVAKEGLTEGYCQPEKKKAILIYLCKKENN